MRCSTVGVLLRSNQFQNGLRVPDIPVFPDAFRQLLPIFGQPAYRQQRGDPPAEAADEVLFQRLGPSFGETVVEGIDTLRRGRGRQGDGIDEELLLFDDPPHKVRDPVQLPAVVAQRIDDARVAEPEPHVVAVGNGHVLVDDANPVSRHGIDEREHRGYDITQRVRRGQRIGAVVDTQNLALKRNRYL